MRMTVPSSVAGSAAPTAPDDTAARLSLNQKTVNQLACPQAGRRLRARPASPAIGLWREPVAGVRGSTRAAKLVRDAGLRVSSLCRGGFFTAADPAGRRRRWTTTGAAIDEAAALGHRHAWSWSPAACRPAAATCPAPAQRVADALAELAPYAGERGRTAGDRAAAPDVLRRPLRGLHPRPGARPRRAVPGRAGRRGRRHLPRLVGPGSCPRRSPAARPAGSPPSSSATGSPPLPAGVLLGRGMIGDGAHRLPRRYRGAVDAAGYTGDDRGGDLQRRRVGAGRRRSPRDGGGPLPADHEHRQQR